MISYKHITKIIGVIMAAAVALCFWMMAFSQEVVETLGGVRVSMAYEEALFDTEEPLRIDIQMARDQWEEMLENAMAEEYYSCDVVINDQKVCNVGIRPKGNTSLSAIAMNPDTDRFSLKLEFDRYVEGQTCLGLDKLILNNNYADATNMKEALVYDMYQYLGADASLYNYAGISLNGEYLGVYLALEAVEESFLMRNYGTADGSLYKPDNMKMGGGAGSGDFGGRPPQPGEKGGRPSRSEMKEEDDGKGRLQERNEDSTQSPSQGVGFPGGELPDFSDGMPFGEENFPGFKEGQKFEKGDFPDGKKPSFADGGQFGRGGPSMGGESGANLNYTDDDLSNYSDIWEGEVTDTGKADHQRVVTALKKINEGTELETYLDVDNILKYMAVHAFSVNMDSLSGNMAHNYYLYESNGMLNILPWDYNLAFGGMNMRAENSASDVVNDAVDTPFDGTKFFDALLENEEYLSRYHAYLRQLTEEYVSGGRFETVYQRIRSQIDTLVETDPTAFYSYEEYEAGAEMLYQTVLLRAKSVKGQIDGTIPATDEGQRTDTASLVDAPEIDLSVMGVMDMGGGGMQKSPGAREER